MVQPMVGPTIRIFSASDIGLTAQASERDFWQSDAAKKIYCDIVWKIFLNPKKESKPIKKESQKIFNTTAVFLRKKKMHFKFSPFFTRSIVLIIKKEVKEFLLMVKGCSCHVAHEEKYHHHYFLAQRIYLVIFSVEF